jgi:small subunit ribosomal protein S8
MLTDPIADMLTRIRNGIHSGKAKVSIPYSKVKEAIVFILQEEGYIQGFEVNGTEPKKIIEVALKFFEKKGIINKLVRVSKPGGRVYVDCDHIPIVKSGYGISVLSTSKGIMADQKARELRLGGEILFSVS